MKVEYRKDVTHSFMILTEIGEVEESYQLNVLLSNRIRGILPLTIESLNDQTACRYEITGLQPLALYCDRISPDTELLKRLYLALMDSLDEFEDYLLDLSHLVLEPEFLYIHWESGELSVPYVPTVSKEIGKSLTELTEYLLTRFGHSNRDCVVLLCNILHELEKPNAQLADVRSVLCFGRNGADVVGSGNGRHRRKTTQDEVSYEIQGSCAESENAADPGLASSGAVPDDQCYTDPENFGDRELIPDTTVSPPQKKRASFLPERDTILSAAGMLACSGAVWIGVNLQTVYGFDTVQKLGACLLSAAVFCLIARAVIRSRNSRRILKAAQEAMLYPPGDLQDEADRLSVPSGDVYDEYESADEDPEHRIGTGEDRYSLSYGGWQEAEERENDCEDTVVLSDKGSQRGIPASMTPVSSESGLSAFVIGSDDLLIGYKKNLVDRVIPNPSVSRIHARIFRKNGAWYVSDLGSTNGTTVNGTPAVGRLELPLSDGAHVSFAGCEYIFHAGSLTA